MSKLKNILKSNGFNSVVLILSVLGTVCFYAGRFNWVFLNITVGFEKFTFLLLYIMIINIMIMSAVLFVKLKSEKIISYKAFKVLNIISEFVGVILFVFGLVYSIILITGESDEAYLLSLKDSLFKGLFFVSIPFLALFLPFIKGKAKTVIVSSFTIIFSFVLLAEFVPFTAYRFTCKPSVLNTGSNYSIVFSTSDFGTGYVEYDYKGKHYKVYDENGGRLKSDSKIHSINVPYEHLENNSYKIGSVRVVEQYSYGSRTGKEIVSEEYKFDFTEKNEMSYLVISDWHTYTDNALEAVSYVGAYDAVILLGDSSPGVDYEQQVIDNIVKFSGELTNGTMPVLYVRGNHETRGEYAGKILDALGLNEFYYNADIGDVSFVVLDSGEDKDDSHPEYGGMTDYNTYRTDMIDWLSTVELKNSKVIALSHSWEISDVEEELSDKGWELLDGLEASLMISGHTHQCRLVGESEREKEIMSRYPEITGFMDGGHSAGKYVASKMKVNEEKIELSSYNNNGEKVFEHSLKWR